MNNRQEFDENSRIIRKSCWFLIVLVVVEVFISVFILKLPVFGSLAVLGLGVITAVSAHRIIRKNKERRGYFLSIWIILRYNPLFFFLLMFSGSWLGYVTPPLETVSFIKMITSYLYLILVIIVFIRGIILIVKISKHNKALKKKIGLD